MIIVTTNLYKIDISSIFKTFIISWNAIYSKRFHTTFEIV